MRAILKYIKKDLDIKYYSLRFKLLLSENIVQNFEHANPSHALIFLNAR